MRDWEHITAEDILKAYVIERRRRASVGSSSGIDDNGRMPSQSPPPDWEQLILMVKRVSHQALDALELRYCGYRIDEKASKKRKAPVAESEWREHTELPTGWDVQSYAEAGALEDEDRPQLITTFMGEFPILLGNREIGRLLGITAHDVKTLTAEAVIVVQENMVRVK